MPKMCAKCNGSGLLGNSSRSEVCDACNGDGEISDPKPDMVNHPPHYKAASGLEAIDVIEAFGLDKSFCLGSAAKYLLRAGKKGDRLEDLRKARWYLDHEIASAEKGAGS